MGKFQKPKAKRKIGKYLQLGIGAAVVLALAVMPMLASREDGSGGTQASILSAAVENRDIATQIMGGGQLSSEGSLNVRIPEHVKLTQYLVGNGDAVLKGDPIATVDKVSVMTAITQVQETLDYLAQEIAAASDDTASSSVKALAGGRVKVVYAGEGETAQDVMLDHGALAVLSLDDVMAVKVERRSALDVGDTVCVTFSDGTEVEGRVKSNLEGVLTVTMEDDGYSVGEKVTVTTGDGDRLGSGELYIFSPWNATAYSGTVADILVQENTSVSIGQSLMTLEDTGNTAKFQRLIDQRQEYEELMQELFVLYRTQTVTAPCDGIVTGVEEDGAYLLSSFDEQEIGAVATVTGVTRQEETEYSGIRLVLLSDVEIPLESGPVLPTGEEAVLISEEGEEDVQPDPEEQNSCTGEADCTYEPHAENCKSRCDLTPDCPAGSHKDGCESQTPSEPEPEQPSISIVTTGLSQGVVGQTYQSFLQAGDGTDFLSGSWAASGLPAGLILDADTGVISGTPAEAGSFSVTVSFTHQETPVVKEFTLTIAEAAAEAETYLGYVAQVTEVGEGVMKVKQTVYTYTIMDLTNLPTVSVDTNALTREATYVSEKISGSAVAVNDYLLIVVDQEGQLVHFTKQELPSRDEQEDVPVEKPETPQESGSADAGMPSGGGIPSGGETPSVSGGSMVQTPVFELYSLEKLTVASVTSQEHMTVSITIDELDINKLHVGQSAVVSVDALGGEQFEAEITEISNSGENSGGNSKFTVEVTLARSGQMLPGMYSSACVTLQTVTGVPCVPVAALDGSGEDSVVYTSYDAESGTLGDPATVTLGASDGEYVQILSGLTEGQTCYYEYYDTYTGSDAPQQRGGGFSLGGMMRMR